MIVITVYMDEGIARHEFMTWAQASAFENAILKADPQVRYVIHGAETTVFQDAA